MPFLTLFADEGLAAAAATSTSAVVRQYAYPQLRRGLRHAWVPALGQTGNRLIDTVGGLNAKHASAAQWRTRRYRGVEHGGTFAAQFTCDYSATTETNATNPFTVMALIYHDVTGLDRICGTDLGANGWALHSTASDELTFDKYLPTRFTATTSGTSLANSKWHSAFGLWQPAKPELEVWVAGNSATDTSAGSAGTDTSQPMGIMCVNSDGGTTWDGAVAAVYIWHRWLSVAERWQLTADPLAPVRQQLVALESAVEAAASATIPVMLHRIREGACGSIIGLHGIEAGNV